MEEFKFLAFDFGAESGRAIIGMINDGRISLQEIHRFPNKQIKTGGHIHWDFQYLFQQLKNGLRLSIEKGHSDIKSIGIDTWGVDFGLIGKDNALLEDPYAYRDSRTDGMMNRVFEKITREEIYSVTGIQFMQINTLFQLYSAKVNQSEILNKSKALLFMPDLFNYFLTGEKYSEYTIASTSQLLDATSKNWNETIFGRLGMPIRIMQPIIQPGTIIGKLLPEIAGEAGLKQAVDVVAVGCHDTASAVAAVPAQSNKWGYLSSGTWSLVGVELDKPVINNASAQYNFTNEGGVGRKIRFLKNVMGMWLLESCIRVWERNHKRYQYDDLMHLAEGAPSFQSVINPDDGSFLNPMNMVDAIQDFCRSHSQKIPVTEGEIVRTVLESLAFRYRWVLDKIEKMQGTKIETVHIVGGGSQNQMLNRFTANATGRQVIAGPVEATALGNVIIQAITKGVIDSIQEGRRLIKDAFPIKQFKPENQDAWNEQYHRIQSMFD